MDENNKSSFFVGYLAPNKSIVKKIYIFIFFLSLLFSLFFFIFVYFLRPSEPGNFEFGTIKKWEGVFISEPIPTLLVREGSEEIHSYLLVGTGKFKVSDELLSLEREQLEIQGTLIAWKNIRMIEVFGFQKINKSDLDLSIPEVTEELGEIKVSGELVDTKCFFGVMRPARGKVHRACAIRCLSGGVPPGLLIQIDTNHKLVLLLADENKKKLKINPEWGGLILKAKGELVLENGLPYLLVREIQN